MNLTDIYRQQEERWVIIHDAGYCIKKKWKKNCKGIAHLPVGRKGQRTDRIKPSFGCISSQTVNVNHSSTVTTNSWRQKVPGWRRPLTSFHSTIECPITLLNYYFVFYFLFRPKSRCQKSTSGLCRLFFNLTTVVKSHSGPSRDKGYINLLQWNPFLCFASDGT